MKLIKKILQRLNGLYYPQDYLCFAKESFTPVLHAYYVQQEKVIREISHEHLFVGYHPVIIALPAIHETPSPKTLEIFFSPDTLPLNGIFRKKDAIASLYLKQIYQQGLGDGRVDYYVAERGEHRFLPAWQQSVQRLDNRWFNKKPGNVFLNGNLFIQVQIAYSMPRVISLITVGDESGYNLFPTDLHGPVNESYYIISLRHEGKACKQVERAGRIVLSEVDCEWYKTVYSLGKNHMQELRPRGDFPFGALTSLSGQLPIPLPALRYRELELQQSFIHDIHKILLFKTLSFCPVKSDPVTLAHVHNSYATWRHNKGLSGNYLLR